MWRSCWGARLDGPNREERFAFPRRTELVVRRAKGPALPMRSQKRRRQSEEGISSSFPIPFRGADVGRPKVETKPFQSASYAEPIGSICRSISFPGFSGFFQMAARAPLRERLSGLAAEDF